MASDEPRPDDNLDQNEISEGEQGPPAESDPSSGDLGEQNVEATESRLDSMAEEVPATEPAQPDNVQQGVDDAVNPDDQSTPAPEKSGSIADRVFDLVANNLGAERSEIAREQTFIGDLSADSLDIVELIMELEEEFDLDIPEDQAEKIETVGQAIDYIESATA